MIAPRFTDQPAPVRRAPDPRAASGIAAPEGGGPPNAEPSGADCFSVLPADRLRDGRAILPAGRDYCVHQMVIADPVYLMLRLAAAHHGIGEDALVARLVVREAEAIGIARLADARGGAPP